MTYNVLGQQTRRRKWKNRPIIWNCILIRYQNLDIFSCQYNKRPSYKNVNKIITCLSCLSRVKKNSCFLFRRFFKLILFCCSCCFYFRISTADCEYYWDVIYIGTSRTNMPRKMSRSNADSAKFIKGLSQWVNI